MSRKISLADKGKDFENRTIDVESPTKDFRPFPPTFSKKNNILGRRFHFPKSEQPPFPVFKPENLTTSVASNEISASIDTYEGAYFVNWYLDGSLINTTDTQNAGAYSYTYTGLNNNQTYTVEVSVVNSDGVEGPKISKDATPEDTTPPSEPSNLTVTSADQQLDADWDDNTESDLAGYNVYLDGNLEVSLISDSQYSFTGLTNGQQYTVEVEAEDTSGNTSTKASATGIPASSAVNDYSLLFSGSDESVDFGQNTGISGSLINQSLTVELWTFILPGGLDSSRHWIAGHGSGTSNDNFQFRIETDNNLYIYLDTTDNNAAVDTGFSPNESQWYHLVATYDGTELKFYLDGSLYFTDTAYGGDMSDASSSPWSIAERYGSSWDYAGVVDEFRIWSSVRTQTEINNNKYKVINPSNEPTLELYTRFEDSSDTSTAVDETSNNRDGTLVGSPAYRRSVPFNPSYNPSFGFETGDISNWTDLSGGLWSAVTDRLYAGSYTGSIQDSNYVDEGVAETSISAKQYSKAGFYWQETSNSTGGMIEFINSNGNVEFAAGTSNPDWDLYHSGGYEMVNGRFNYDLWIYFEFEIDWSTGDFVFYGEDLEFEQEFQNTYSLRHGVDIAKIRVRNYGATNDLVQDGIVMWFDNIHVIE